MHFKTAAHWRYQAARHCERTGAFRGARVVLAIAKLHARETPYDLLRAMPTLASDVHLVIAGTAWSNRPSRPIASTAPERVHLLSRTQYPPYRSYAAAELLVHAPQEEPPGRRALACGLPSLRAASRRGSRPAGRRWKWVRVRTGDERDLAIKVSAALALSRGSVASASVPALAKWDYATSWRSLMTAASSSNSAG